MRIIILILLLLPAVQLQAQTADEKASITDRYVAGIQKRTDLEQKTLINEEFMPYVTDGGGTLKISYSGDSILCINEWIGLSYGYIETNFYYRQGSLVYVSESEWAFTYDESKGEMNQADPNQVYYASFYFESDKIYKENREGARTFDEEMLFDSQTKEGVLISASEQYLKLYSKTQ